MWKKAYEHDEHKWRKYKSQKWEMLWSGFEPCVNLKVALNLMKRVVSLSDVARRLNLDQSFSHVSACVDQYMSINKIFHANTAKADQTSSGKWKPRTFMRIHHVHNHQDPNITEIHETYIIGTVLQHTSSIQHQFHLILTISKESSRESFNNQTSNHGNYLNIARNQ